MVYEIYFDSKSQYRESAKFGYGSSVLSLLIEDDFRQAKNFIRRHLQNYMEKLLFVPDSVVFMGKELITEHSSSWFNPYFNLPKIRDEISTQLAIPKWALTLKPNETVGDKRLSLPAGKILNPLLALNRETT